MAKNKLVIFGAGVAGTSLYKKLTLTHDVIAYSDNDSTLWGKERNGVTIIPPEELPGFVERSGASILIANEYYYEDIACQLDGMGLTYKICKGIGCCYEMEDRVLYPCTLDRPAPYKKTDTANLSVLFVQPKPCTRTNKIAGALKKRGIHTYSAYTIAPSDAGAQAYEEEFPFWSYADLLQFVNESEFDVIHCSNTPDILVSVLLHSNKKIIHDCHDVLFFEGKHASQEEIALEFIANTQADGVIFTTEAMRKIMMRRYGIPQEKTLVVGNYPLSSFQAVDRLPKLSAADGNIHCVFEGGISSRETSTHTPYLLYETFFVQLAQMGIHVHIYSPSDPVYLSQLDHTYDNIHYEGNYNGHELVKRMTQYDIGLAWYAVTGYLNISSPNKIYEYLSAGLPVVTNVKQYIELFKAKHCGGTLDFEKEDVVSQLQAIKQISVPANFCDTHGFTVETNVDRILAFYQKIYNIK